MRRGLARSARRTRRTCEGVVELEIDTLSDSHRIASLTEESIKDMRFIRQLTPGTRTTRHPSDPRYATFAASRAGRIDRHRHRSADVAERWRNATDAGDSPQTLDCPRDRVPLRIRETGLQRYAIGDYTRPCRNALRNARCARLSPGYLASISKPRRCCRRSVTSSKILGVSIAFTAASRRRSR